MKKLLLVVAIITSYVSVAQPKNPVSFKFEAVKKTADTYEVIIKATLEKPWHIYAQNTPKGGPVPTKITFKANPLAKISGSVIEKGKLEKAMDKTFGVNVLSYSNEVSFVQTFKVKAGVKTTISGSIEYMVCNDETCLPPKNVTFSIQIK